MIVLCDGIDQSSIMTIGIPPSSLHARMIYLGPLRACTSHEDALTEAARIKDELLTDPQLAEFDHIKINEMIDALIAYYWS